MIDTISLIAKDVLGITNIAVGVCKVLPSEEHIVVLPEPEAILLEADDEAYYACDTLEIDVYVKGEHCDNIAEFNKALLEAGYEVEEGQVVDAEPTLALYHYYYRLKEYKLNE